MVATRKMMMIMKMTTKEEVVVVLDAKLNEIYYTEFRNQGVLGFWGGLKINGKNS